MNTLERERDAALAMSERYRDHEFARPLDSQGCCAVCHQPLDFEAHRPASLTTERDAAVALAGRLKEALEFYADPSTYVAIGFLPDPPCGEFTEDFDDTDLGWKPGKRARALLADLAVERLKR